MARKRKNTKAERAPKQVEPSKVVKKKAPGRPKDLPELTEREWGVLFNGKIIFQTNDEQDARSVYLTRENEEFAKGSAGGEVVLTRNNIPTQSVTNLP